MARQTIKSEGLNELRKALAAYPDEFVPIAQRKLLGVAEIAAAAAARRLPKGNTYRVVKDRNGKTRRRERERTGDAASSILVRKSGKANVVIQGGNNRDAPYFGWLDFGGKIRPQGNKAAPIVRPVAPKGRYIYPAAADNADRMNKAMDEAANDVTRRLGLD